jgi:hypothetical protein
MRVDNTTLIDKFSDRIHWDDLDFESFATQPLGSDTLRCLRYMHDVEFHTICYLRDLLLTPAHSDASVTGFLSLWAYQEYWHGEAIASVLAAHGEPSGTGRVQVVRGRLGLRDKVRTILMSVGGWVGGGDFTAVHMAWGAINEWTTQAGYAQLAQRSGNSVLSELLKRIMKQEGRHIDFYAGEAARRLGESSRAQHLTRTALRKFWGPVGSGLMPPEEVAFLSRYLFGDDRGQAAAERIDRQVDRLPGMSGLALMKTATARAA